MIRTIKLRIYPNKTQQTALLHMAKGVDRAWNYINDMQSSLIQNNTKEKCIISYEDKRPSKKIYQIMKSGKVGVSPVSFKINEKFKTKIKVPYKTGEIQTKEEGVLYRFETLTHFLGQYTNFGKELKSIYRVPSNTNIQICEQFAINTKKYTKDNLNEYILNGYRLKSKTKANWIPFNNGGISLIKKDSNKKGQHFKFDNHIIRISADNRNLEDLINNNDKKLYNPNTNIKESLKSGCITRDRLNRWYLHVAVELQDIKQVKKVDGVIGIDPGFNTCITTSDGEKFSRPLPDSTSPIDYTFLDQRLERLKKYKDKSKGGKSRTKTETYGRPFMKDGKLIQKQRSVYINKGKHISRKIFKLETKRTAMKRNWEWSVANQIVAKGKNIVIGDLMKGGGMQKNSGSSVLREAIFTLWSAIEFKAQSQGLKAYRVNERYTTVTCSKCKERTGPTGLKDLGKRSWKCESCGAEHDRDINAAINIRERYADVSEKDRNKEINELIRGHFRALINAENKDYEKIKKQIEIKLITSKKNSNKYKVKSSLGDSKKTYKTWNIKFDTASNDIKILSK